MILAVVRVRGIGKIRPQVEKTLRLLHLERPHHCVLAVDSPQNMGMLRYVKDYVTFGPVTEDTVYRLLYKRGREGGNFLHNTLKETEIKKIAKEVFSGKKVGEHANPVFRLKPPSKGYKNIKMAYPNGDLGKRDEMDSLIRRMA